MHLSYRQSTSRFWAHVSKFIKKSIAIKHCVLAAIDVVRSMHSFESWQIREQYRGANRNENPLPYFFRVIVGVIKLHSDNVERLSWQTFYFFWSGGVAMRYKHWASFKRVNKRRFSLLTTTHEHLTRKTTRTGGVRWRRDCVNDPKGKLTE